MHEAKGWLRCEPRRSWVAWGGAAASCATAADVGFGSDGRFRVRVSIAHRRTLASGNGCSGRALRGGLSPAAPTPAGREAAAAHAAARGAAAAW
eukprot:CAMPEP_0180063234 /NCGR_PEP_ID=MMETSP0985-20121206/7532_1 /TAXON_ID=483367 /ORGANISM="non described non described, Strain CCMP 2436" /LENGTH=93 /DNA_ID=CAMNT_0021993441 /DNA_START=120 /DNA_END=401 /DNA_ORIENTATION=+